MDMYRYMRSLWQLFHLFFYRCGFSCSFICPYQQKPSQKRMVSCLKSKKTFLNLMETLFGREKQTLYWAVPGHVRVNQLVNGLFLKEAKEHACFSVKVKHTWQIRLLNKMEPFIWKRYFKVVPLPVPCYSGRVLRQAAAVLNYASLTDL